MKDQKVRFVQPFFCAGEGIPEAGIYHVFHGQHRVSYEVTLLAGERFPKCQQCGAQVRFVLVRAAPQIGYDRDFKVRLHQVPHPPEAEATAAD